MADIERLDLETLPEGTSLQIKTSSPPAVTYQVRILEKGHMPVCEITEKNQDDEIIAGPTEVILVGTGHWTTPDQNPTQGGDCLFGRPYQEKTISIDYSRLNIGGFLILHDPKRRNRNRTFLELAMTDIIMNDPNPKIATHE